jgi:hypothetical protein
MNLTILQTFRHGIYRCFKRAADALFNTVDARLPESTAHSFAELSLSPCFERQWPSLYEAFEDGQIDRSQLQQVMAGAIPVPAAGTRRLVAVDATAIARPQSETSADRTSMVVHNLPRCKTVPITAGWHFATLVVLPEQPGSGCYVLDNRRIAS